jgi:hypothetical protein
MKLPLARTQIAMKYKVTPGNQLRALEFVIFLSAVLIGCLMYFDSSLVFLWLFGVQILLVLFPYSARVSCMDLDRQLR